MLSAFVIMANGAPSLLEAHPESVWRPQPVVPTAIVGGAPAEDGAYPDVVAIYTRNDSFGCTGTLIAPDLVLTAGHCGFGMESVRVGTQDLSDGGTYIPIAETWIYPDYFSTLDVAVYRLETPSEIPPRSLLLDCLAYDHLVIGGDAVIVGFGDIDTFATESTDLLHEAVATIRDPLCADPADACNPAVSPGGEFIAGGDGVDTCNGDSGGPILVQTPSGLLLAGVTSRAAEPHTVPCGDGGIYPRADVFTPWIEAQTGVSFPRPDCPDINRPPIPSGLSIEVTQGGPVGMSLIRINDPDPDQAHTLRISTPPSDGEAWIDGENLVYLPPQFAAGDQQVTVSATDDGDPPLTGETTVSITVLDAPVEAYDPPETKGCATASGSWWLLAPQLAIAPRR